MVVCVCYNLNEEKINDAIDIGVAPDGVYEHFECDSPCECCMDTINEMFVERSQYID